MAIVAVDAATDAAATEAADRVRDPGTARAASGAGSWSGSGFGSCFVSGGGVWWPGVPTPLVEGGASIGTSARRFGALDGLSGRG